MKAAPAPGSTPGVSTVAASGNQPTRKRKRAKALFARIRDKQLRFAMSGRIVESAVYARRALRVREAVCPCTA